MTTTHSDAPLSPAATVWRLPQLHNLELLRGMRLTHSFPRHTHECYAFGVIEQGALGYFYRGENVIATPGCINLCVPGEAHTGQPATATGWSYRMFYLDTALIQRVADDMAGRPRDLPFFAAGVIHDPALAHLLHAAHCHMEAIHAPRLEQETALIRVLAQFIQRHADDPPAVRRAGNEPRAVAQIKHYLESHYAEDIALEQLAQHASLSRFHLLRVFHAATGISPHTYLRQVRVRHAKAMLVAGQPIADVALATGFADQSHLSRWFKRLWGFTPGQYRNNVQDTTISKGYAASMPPA